MTLAVDYESARSVAADILSGDFKPKQTQIKNKLEKKSSNKLIYFILLPFLIYSFFYFSRPNITGFAVTDRQGEILKNSSIVFYNIDNNKHYCVPTSQNGDFDIRIPKGNYKVYGNGSEISEKHKNPESSLLNLNISNNIRLRITVKK